MRVSAYNGRFKVNRDEGRVYILAGTYAKPEWRFYKNLADLKGRELVKATEYWIYNLRVKLDDYLNGVLEGLG